jgi:hypothetical protein
MPASPKFVQMIEQLATASEQGRLEWQESDSEDFLVDLGRASIRIECDRDCDYDVTLYDGKRRVLELERFSSNENENGEHYILVNRLFTAARRSACKIDEVIDQVINDVAALTR